VAGVGDHQREVLPVTAVGIQQSGGLGVTLELEPLEGHLVAGQEVFDRVRRR